MKRSTFNETLLEQPTKEFVYVLGFLWGDGYLRKYYNYLETEITTKDLDNIIHVFNTIGTWNRQDRQRTNRQPQSMINMSNKTFKNFLISLDYDKKSHCSHKKVINYIPKELQSYWLRGYFDADGCIYLNIPNRTRQFSFCSTYEQDWEFLHQYLLEHNINNKITRRIQKNNRHSIIRGCGWQNCLNLFKFIYPDYKYDFGLSRKHDKLYSLLDISNTKHAICL